MRNVDGGDRDGAEPERLDESVGAHRRRAERVTAATAGRRNRKECLRKIGGPAAKVQLSMMTVKEGILEIKTKTEEW